MRDSIVWRRSTRLPLEGAVTSVGSKGDSYDNALAETVNGLYKTELIRAQGPWRTVDQVELATAGWVAWWNAERLHGACGDIPPAEFESAYHQRLQATGHDRGRLKSNQLKASTEPSTVHFRTKLELAADMLTAATTWGHLPYQWVTADAAYGDAADLRALVASLGRWYRVEVSGTTTVWTADPAWAVPPRAGRTGRPRTKPRPGAATPDAQAVRDIARALPPDAWIRHRVTEGEKGPREYEFARLRVVEKVHRTPGQAGWLLARRPVDADETTEIKCYLSNAPATIALAEMAAVGCLRWTIEEDFELAKGEVGLDHYEVTRYRGWYHHITLSLLALAFLKAVQREWGKNGDLASVPEIRQLLEVVLPVDRWSAATAIAWYEDQQRRKAAARASHRRRWLREHPERLQPAL